MFTAPYWMSVFVGFRDWLDWVSGSLMLCSGNVRMVEFVGYSFVIVLGLTGCSVEKSG